MTLTDKDMMELADLIQATKAQAWEEGFTQGADYYYEGNSKPTDFTETAQTLNPYKENN